MGLSKNLHNYITNGFRCFYCESPLVKNPVKDEKWRTATRDHKTPKVRGGSDRKSNIVLACARCNNIKGDMTAEEFLHFRGTGRIQTSYITWLEAKLCKLLSIDKKTS